MSNLALLDQSLPDFLQTAGVSALTKNLAGKSGAKRIVPKNGIFRKTVGMEEMGKIKGSLNAIVVSASPKVGRIFYASAWTPDSEPTSPDCFSNDGQSPDKGSTSPQADRCDACPNNIKGSGQGTSKACRYTRRIAIALEEDFGTALQGEVYQMNLASKSLFGDNVGDNSFTFENYAKYLSNNGKSIDYVVTTISFNEDNDNMSVLFSPARFINQEEFAVTSKLSALPEVQKLVVMTPYEAQMSTTKILPKPEAKVEAKVEAKAEAVAEPVKRPKAEAPAVAPKKELDDVLKAWSEED
jgi:hypothetical protein